MTHQDLSHKPQNTPHKSWRRLDLSKKSDQSTDALPDLGGWEDDAGLPAGENYITS